jgi:ribosomal protein L16 Arg81 hydroxylase
VTPAGTETFGWHYDWEDVFIAQTVGSKDYHFRNNTVAQDAAFSTQPDFSCVRRETSPLFGALLIPGDWLYIPRRWWHLVRSLEDSLSISIGVVPDGVGPSERGEPAADGAGAARGRSPRAG